MALFKGRLIPGIITLSVLVSSLPQAFAGETAEDDMYITIDDIPKVREHTAFEYEKETVNLKDGLLASFGFNEDDGATESYDSVNNIKATMVAGLPGWCTTANENIQEWDYSNVKLDYVNPETYMGALSKNDGMPRFTKRKNGAFGSYVGFYNIGTGIEIEENDKIPAANNDEYSISFWVKGEASAIRQNKVVYEERGKGKSYIKFIAAERDMPEYHYYEGGYLRVVIADEAGNIILDKMTEGYPFDLSWNMVTFTDKKGEAAVYINGEKDPVDFSYDYSKKPEYVKSYIGTPEDEVDGTENRGANYYYGAVDDFNFYNRVITPAEMKYLFYECKTDRVAWLDFEDGVSDYEKNLSLSGEPEITDGVINKGLKLSSSFEGKKHPSLEFDETFTAMFWIKRDSDGENKVISRGDDFEITVGNEVKFTVTDDEGNKTEIKAPAPDKNKWFHVGAVANGEKLILYINAENKAEAEYNGSVKVSGNIKVSDGDNVGVIDELRIHNYGCSRTEMKLMQDMDPSYIKSTADRLYNMIDEADSNMTEIINAYKNGQYNRMLELFRDYYFEVVDKEIFPNLDDSLANGTWLCYGYDDEKVLYGRGESYASFDDIGEFGDINWEYGAFREIEQYHHMTVEYWQWSLEQMENLTFKMFVSFGQEEYLERFAKFVRDLSMHRYDMLISNRAEWNAVGFQQPLHPNLSQSAIKYISTHLLYFIKVHPEYAKRYFTPTILVECLEETSTRYAPDLLNVSAFGNHEVDSISYGAEFALRFKGLKFGNTVYDKAMDYVRRFQNGEFMKDGTGIEATWHYAIALPKKFSAMYDMFKGLNYGDYNMSILKNQVTQRSRMIGCHVLPYGDSFIGIGSSAGSGLWGNASGYDTEVNDRFVLLQDSVLKTSLGKTDPLLKQLENVVKNDGEYPAFTSMTFPYVGNSLLRSGWEDDDSLLFLVGSEYRQKECSDKLSVQLASKGRLLLGRAGHSQGNSALGIQGSYAYTSIGNNTVNVDDCIHAVPDMYQENYRNEPMPYRFLTTENFDFTEGVYDSGYYDYKNYIEESTAQNNIYQPNLEKKAKDVSHQRQVISVRDKDFYIVLDRMTADESHKYHQEWHVPSIFAEEDVEVSDDGFITKDDTGANVALYQFYNRPLTHEKYYGYVNEDETLARGWEMRLYSGEWDKSTDVRFTFESEGNTVLATVITPLENTSEIVKSKKNIANGSVQGFEIELTDGTVISLLTSYNTASLSLDGVNANAKTLLTVKESGKPVKGIVLDTSSCDINGESIDCRYRNSYEFVCGDSLELTPITIPQTFKWVEENGNLVPKYENIDLSELK